MQTSAPAALVLEGTLVRDAVVSVRAGDHEHAVPVLCADLQDVGPGLRTVHVEAPYHHAHRFAADAAALQLKKGRRVQIPLNFAGAHLVLPNTPSISLVEKGAS